MKRLNKILITLSIMIAFTFAFMPDILASAIKINGGTLDIYTTGGEGSAKYDSATKTLTLNNYNNEHILIEGFDGETLTVVLRGNNVIKSTTGYVEYTYDAALGYADNDTDDVVTLNIIGEKDSKLIVDGYYSGISIYEGKINLTNVNLEAKNIDYAVIYNNYGELTSVKDSKIIISKTKYGFRSYKHSIVLDNVDYTSDKTDRDDFYTGEDLTIKNSKFDVTETAGLFNNKDLILDNSKVNVHSGIELMTVYSATINNSIIDANISLVGIIGVMDPRASEEYLHVDNSDITVLTPTGAVLAIQTGDTIDFDNVVVYKNLTMLEKNYYKTKGNLDGEGAIYGYYVTEPTDETYDIVDLLALGAKELHLVAENIVSFDANGATGEMEDVYVSGKYTLPDCTFTAPEGKKFAGWSLSKDGEIITELNVNERVTVYAIWKDINEVNNPKTGDNYISYIIIGSVSIIGLIGASLYIKKRFAK